MSEEIRLSELYLDSNAGLLKLGLSDGTHLEMAPDTPEAQGLALGCLVPLNLKMQLELAARRKETARRIFDLLNRRQYSSHRLRIKLHEDGYPEEAIDAVLPQFQKEGLLDDHRYAEAWCRDQLRRKPVGRFWLKSGLLKEGLDSSLIQQALDEVFPPDLEPEQAQRALESRRYDLSLEKERHRAMRFLQGRGFPGAVCRRLVLDRSRDASAGCGSEGDLS